MNSKSEKPGSPNNKFYSVFQNASRFVESRTPLASEMVM